MSVSLANRRTVFARDDYRCRTCCTTEHLSIDHVIPRSAGGSDELDNLQTLCRSCNSRKGGHRRARGLPCVIVLHIRHSSAELGGLDRLAEQEQRTRSDMARILLGEALNRRRNGP